MKKSTKFVCRIAILTAFVALFLGTFTVCKAGNQLWRISHKVSTQIELCAGSPDEQIAIDKAVAEAKAARNEILNSGNSVQKFLATAGDFTQVMTCLLAVVLLVCSAIGIVWMSFVICYSAKHHHRKVRTKA